MARTNKVNDGNSGAFKHRTSIGENGELVYDAPIVIQNEDDMKNYGITDADCRYLHFGTSQKIRVYFFKTTNRALAEYQWEHINNLHSSGYFSTRCMVLGVRKRFIRCRDTNKCSACPYGMTPETKSAAVISWDELIKGGYEPTSADSVEGQGNTNKMYEELCDRMNAEDPRIARALEARIFRDDPVKKIAKDLNVSEPRIYQMLTRAKTIVREYLDE